MPNYSDRIIDAAVQSGLIERESMGIVNPSILMWDILVRVGQIFCSDGVYHEMNNVNEAGDYFSVPYDCEILKGIEGLLMLEENFMRRVPHEFRNDPIRYISLGWSTWGEYDSFEEEELHTFINSIPLAVQRFCYRAYEESIGDDENQADDEGCVDFNEGDDENQADDEGCVDFNEGDDVQIQGEGEEDEEDEEENYISDASTDIVTDNEYDSSSDSESEYDSMPELESASDHDNYIECPESSPWIYYPNYPNNNSIQI